MKTLMVIATASVLTLGGWHRAPAESAAVQTYYGMCDASAVMSVNNDLFVVADDEDSVMRVYSRARPGVAVGSRNLAPFLGFSSQDEADFEGGARIGDRIYWITSHGTNRKGKEQESRQRFFSVQVRAGNGTATIQPVGLPYSRLLDDLLAEPRLAGFDLHRAAQLPPKSPGALNIEGLASTPEGHLLIGFRNPVPQGRALLVRLVNPAEVIQGARARFGEPRLINLGGYGIRSIEQWRGGYFIIAGSVDGKGKSRLYEWDGGSGQPKLHRDVDFTGINPEAITVMEQGGEVSLLVVSDDGTRVIDGEECKMLKDPARRTFRAATVVVTPQVAGKSRTASP